MLCNRQPFLVIVLLLSLLAAVPVFGQCPDYFCDECNTPSQCTKVRNQVPERSRIHCDTLIENISVRVQCSKGYGVVNGKCEKCQQDKCERCDGGKCSEVIYLCMYKTTENVLPRNFVNFLGQLWLNSRNAFQFNLIAVHWRME